MRWKTVKQAQVHIIWKWQLLCESKRDKILTTKLDVNMQIVSWDSQDCSCFILLKAIKPFLLDRQNKQLTQIYFENSWFLLIFCIWFPLQVPVVMSHADIGQVIDSVHDTVCTGTISRNTVQFVMLEGRNSYSCYPDFSICRFYHRHRKLFSGVGLTLFRTAILEEGSKAPSLLGNFWIFEGS